MNIEEEMIAEKVFWKAIENKYKWEILSFLKDILHGGTFESARRYTKFSRTTLWRVIKRNPHFALDVATAREIGERQRKYNLWLKHPFRGKRPPQKNPTGKYPKPRYYVGQYYRG